MAKRRRKHKSLPVRSGEGATVERCQQLGGIVKEVVDRCVDDKVYIVRHRAIECMLDAYLLRKLIEKHEHKAGMRYRMAWLRAREGIRVSDRLSSGAALSYENSLLIIPESERILKEAHKVLTKAQKPLIMRVCVDSKVAGGTDSLETLRRGLQRLAIQWRIF